MENNQENKTNENAKEVKVETVSVKTATEKKQPEPATEPAPEQKVESESEKLIGELQDKVADLTDKYMRVAAELENTRRRAARDTESAARTCGMEISKKFLPVMDALAVALKQTPDDQGIKSLSLALESAFAQIGIVKIESIGQQLNPQFHSAISVVPADETHPANIIVDEMQTGYMYGDTVLRPAMVIVSK